MPISNISTSGIYDASSASNHPTTAASQTQRYFASQTQGLSRRSSSKSSSISSDTFSAVSQPTRIDLCCSNRQMRLSQENQWTPGAQWDVRASLGSTQSYPVSSESFSSRNQRSLTLHKIEEHGGTWSTAKVHFYTRPIEVVQMF